MSLDRRFVLLGALVVMLVGLGALLLPTASTCSIPAVEAFDRGGMQTPPDLFSGMTLPDGSSVKAVPVKPIYVTNRCYKASRGRLWLALVLIGLAALGATIWEAFSRRTIARV